MSHHLVVGAGPVGTATALLLAERGESVTVVTRRGSGPEGDGITRTAADASSSEALTALAEGSVAIYNCANPAYHRWATDWPPLAQSLLLAAERSGAVLATVGNLYPYGPVGVPMTEDLPPVATGTKARVRARMWADALAAHTAGRLRATEVRGSDYLCPGPSSQLGDRVMPRLLAGKKVSVLASADQPHTWTDVRDVARLLVTVAADPRGWGRVWHVPSNAPRSQREVVEDLCRAAGLPPVPVAEYPAVLMRLLGLVDPVIRELPETAYQRERPYVLDDSAARTTFGLVPTPWQDVLDTQVAAYRTPVAVG